MIYKDFRTFSFYLGFGKRIIFNRNLVKAVLMLLEENEINT